MSALPKPSLPAAFGLDGRRLLMFGAYLLLLAGLAGAGAVALADAWGARASARESEARRAELALRPPAGAAARRGEPVAAWLTDRTAGLASATLQARVEAAARAARARTLSSRVELGEAAGSGELAYAGEFELDAAALQPLLYDLEAGAPFLVVQDLAVRAPPGPEGGARLRLALTLGAAWRPAP